MATGNARSGYATASGSSRRVASLSAVSVYEQMFGTRHRSVGRPAGDVEPVFVDPTGGGVDPLLLSVAKRRAYAVVHQENRERLAEVFAVELKVLRRRGVKVVAGDVGVNLPDDDEAEDDGPNGSGSAVSRGRE